MSILVSAPVHDVGQRSVLLEAMILYMRVASIRVPFTSEANIPFLESQLVNQLSAAMGVCALSACAAPIQFSRYFLWDALLVFTLCMLL